MLSLSLSLSLSLALSLLSSLFSLSLFSSLSSLSPRSIVQQLEKESKDAKNLSEGNVRKQINYEHEMYFAGERVFFINFFFVLVVELSTPTSHKLYSIPFTQ